MLRTAAADLVAALHRASDAEDVALFGKALGAVIELLQEPASIECTSELGVAEALGAVLQSLARQVEGAAAADAAAACEQASCLLVALSNSCQPVRARTARNVGISRLARFMNAVALAASRPLCSLRVRRHRQPCSADGGPERGPYAAPNPLPVAVADAVLRNCCWSLFLLCDAASGAGTPCLHARPSGGFSVSAAGPHSSSAAGRPGATAAAAADDDHPHALAVEVGRALLFSSRAPPSEPSARAQGAAGARVEHGAARGAGTAAAPASAPVGVLLRLLASWDGLEAVLLASGVLACLALEEQADSQLTRRATRMLLSERTLGPLCEALYRVGPLRDAPPPFGAAAAASGAAACASALGGWAAEAPPAAPQAERVVRACTVLGAFFAHVLASPAAAAVFLDNLVREHAVGWFLHAPALSMSLRRQMVRQLLGSQGQQALAGPGAGVIDAPLALCHVISAPPGCHSLLPPDVADYLLAAAPFGLQQAQPAGQQGHEQQALADAAAAGRADAPLAPAGLPLQQQQQPAGLGLAQAGGHGARLGGAPVGAPPAWLPHAIQQAQALGDAQAPGPNAPWQHHAPAPAMHAAPAAADPDAAAAAAGAGAAAAGEQPRNRDSERPVSTLAVACRMLLAGGRLENAFGAFFSDLRTASRAAAALQLAALRYVGNGAQPGGAHWGGASLSARVSLADSDLCSWSDDGSGVGSRGAGVQERSGGGSGAAADGSAQALPALPPGASWAMAAALPSLQTPPAYGPAAATAVTAQQPHAADAGAAAAQAQRGASEPGAPTGSSPSLTDVVAGVASLVDAMLCRSASLSAFRWLRGEGVDHNDSMSASVSVGAICVDALEARSSLSPCRSGASGSSGGGAERPAWACRQGLRGSVGTSQLPLAQQRSGGSAWGELAGLALAPAACDALPWVRRLLDSSSASASGCSSGAGSGSAGSRRVVRHARAVLRRVIDVRDSGRASGASTRVSGGGAGGALVGGGAAADSDPDTALSVSHDSSCAAAPREADVASASKPDMLSDPARPPRPAGPSHASALLPQPSSWPLASHSEAAGEADPFDAHRQLANMPGALLSSLSADAVALAVAPAGAPWAPAASRSRAVSTGAGGGGARCPSQLAWPRASGLRTDAGPQDVVSGRAACRDAVLASFDSSIAASSGATAGGADTAGSTAETTGAGASSQGAHADADAAGAAAGAEAQAAPPGDAAAGLGRLSASGGARLPPYTYFGSTRLTAAALAMPVEAAVGAAALNSPRARGCNSAASSMAIAAASAAAAAIAAAGLLNSAGRRAPSTAATTLAASAAKHFPLPSGGGGGGGAEAGHTAANARSGAGASGSAAAGAGPAQAAHGLLAFGLASWEPADPQEDNEWLDLDCSSPGDQGGDLSGPAELWAGWGRGGASPPGGEQPRNIRAPSHVAAPFEIAAEPEAELLQELQLVPWSDLTQASLAAAAAAGASPGARAASLAAAGGGLTSATTDTAPSFGVDALFAAPSVDEAAPVCYEDAAARRSSGGPLRAQSDALASCLPASAVVQRRPNGQSGTLERDGSGTVFAFGAEQVEVPERAFRLLRRSSCLLYGLLSRVADRSRPITLVQVPGLDDAANCRVFRQILGWAMGERNVGRLLLLQQQARQQARTTWQQQEQQRADCLEAEQLAWAMPGGSGDAASPFVPFTAVHDASCGTAAPPTATADGFPEITALGSTDEGEDYNTDQLQQLGILWRAADYLQVDDLFTAVEDELAFRFTLPPPEGPAAWCAALALASSQRHAAPRLANLCALHFMRSMRTLLGDERALAAAAAAAGVLQPAVLAEVRDRLVALVALADEDITAE